MKHFAALVFFLVSVTVSAQDVVLSEFARVHRFCEGPVFDAEGNLYVSHRPFISKIAADGTVSRWAETGNPNGHKILSDGTHLVADRQILHLDADGVVLGPAADTCGQYPTRETNDISLNPGGGFYFTDPGPFGDGAIERPIGRVCFSAPDGKTHLVADGLVYPNGIVVRPDGRSLVVGETGQKRVVEYPLLTSGEVGTMRVLVELPTQGAAGGPDGMALDTNGTLYVAHYGEGRIHVVSAEGELLESWPAGNLGSSNVAFGGEKMNYLYTTGGGAGVVSEGPGIIYRLEVPEHVTGLKIPPER